MEAILKNLTNDIEETELQIKSKWKNEDFTVLQEKDLTHLNKLVAGISYHREKPSSLWSTLTGAFATTAAALQESFIAKSNSILEKIQSLEKASLVPPEDIKVTEKLALDLAYAKAEYYTIHGQMLIDLQGQLTEHKRQLSQKNSAEIDTIKQQIYTEIQSLKYDDKELNLQKDLLKKMAR